MLKTALRAALFSTFLSFSGYAAEGPNDLWGPKHAHLNPPEVTVECKGKVLLILGKGKAIAGETFKTLERCNEENLRIAKLIAVAKMHSRKVSISFDKTLRIKVSEAPSSELPNDEDEKAKNRLMEKMANKRRAGAPPVGHTQPESEPPHALPPN